MTGPRVNIGIMEKNTEITIMELGFRIWCLGFSVGFGVYILRPLTPR